MCSHANLYLLLDTGSFGEGLELGGGGGGGGQGGSGIHYSLKIWPIIHLIKFWVIH